MCDYNLRKNIDNLKELEDNSIEKIYAHISSIFISFIYFVKDDGEDLKIKSRYINNLNTKNHEID